MIGLYLCRLGLTSVRSWACHCGEATFKVERVGDTFPCEVSSFGVTKLTQCPLPWPMIAFQTGNSSRPCRTLCLTALQNILKCYTCRISLWFQLYNHWHGPPPVQPSSSDNCEKTTWRSYLFLIVWWNAIRKWIIRQHLWFLSVSGTRQLGDGWGSVGSKTRKPV